MCKLQLSLVGKLEKVLSASWEHCAPFWTPLWEKANLQESKTLNISILPYLNISLNWMKIICLGSWFAFCGICMETPSGNITCLEQQTQSWWELEDRGKVQYTLEGGSKWYQDWLLFHSRCWMRSRLPCREPWISEAEGGGRESKGVAWGREGPSC